METHPSKAVFLSYASQDATAARRIVEALRTAGVEVWFDQSELRGGEVWDHRIRQQIKECGLFLPVISAHTQDRREGYFRLEWNLAEERTHLMASGTPFLVPVCVDATRERTALVPDAFLLVQWTRLPDGETPPGFCEQVRRLLTGGASATTAAPAPITSAPNIPDYELLRMIGQGSYGDVWLARGVTGIYRAIKVVWRERFADAGPFEREFHGLKEFAAISLGEGSLLALLHVGRNDEAGFFYYVMELADDIERGREIEPAHYVPLTLTVMRGRRGRLPTAECVNFGVELARELAGLHRHGLVHRDIKPSNVILVGGVAKLADIGLVTPASDARTFVGTEGFVPPEGPGSPRADIFALGKLLYELSTGLDRQQFPQLPPGLNRLPDRRALLRLNEVILRACDPLPEKRHAAGQALLEDLLALQAGRPVRRLPPHTRVTLFAAAATVAFLVGVAALWRKQGIPLAEAQPTAPLTGSPMLLPDSGLPALEKSLVVLPLENLSPEPEDAFFASGMHAVIVATLRRIPDLNVVGRESSVSAKQGADPPAKIGQRFGVGNILSGSVRRGGSRVRIALELQRCADEVLLWTQIYEREFRETLALESEIAEEVARVLQSRTTRDPTKAAAILAKDPKAYELYLEGVGALGRESGRNREARVHAAIEFFDRSLQLDPNFLPAAQGLSVRHSMIFSNYEKDLSNRTEHARAAKYWAERASQLMPGGAGDLALAYYCTNVENDNVRALLLAEKILRVQPNNADACNYLAMALGGLGRAPEGRAWTRRAIALDPQQMIYRQNELLQLATMRRRDEWRVAMAEYRRRAQGSEMKHWAIFLSRYRLFGELPAIDEITQMVPASQANYLWLSRRFEVTHEFIAAELVNPELRNLDRFELLCRQVDVLTRLGNQPAADQSARRLAALAEEMQRIPEIDNSEKDLRTARAMVRRGRHEEAIAAGRRCVDAMRIPEQQLRRWVRETKLAEILAEAERPRECLDLIARLLRVPSTLTVPMLRVDPVWDHLRANPEFQALLRDPKNDAPF